MASYSIRREVSVRQSIAPEVLTADKDGDGVDTLGFETVLVLFDFGASGDTLSGSVKFEAVLQESDDDSTYTDVAAGYLDGTLPTVDDPAEDAAVYTVGYLGSKRYVRAQIDATGTHSNGTPIGASVFLARPKEAPTS